MPTNKVKFNVCGSDYIINCEDSEEYIQMLAERLDSEMKEFLKHTPSSSITTAAVLTALSYLDDLQKTNSGADNMRSQIKEYLEDAAAAKQASEQARQDLYQANLQLDKAFTEIDRLKKEIGYMRGEN